MFCSLFFSLSWERFTILQFRGTLKRFFQFSNDHYRENLFLFAIKCLCTLSTTHIHKHKHIHSLTNYIIFILFTGFSIIFNSNESPWFASFQFILIIFVCFLFFHHLFIICFVTYIHQFPCTSHHSQFQCITFAVIDKKKWVL